jgi:probable selenium-dependent hydroxylase accessory protein YqeC
LDQLLAQSGASSSTNVITLIGGGGKTSLMHLWAKKFHAQGISVVTSTTTKLYNKLQPGFHFAQPKDLIEAHALLDTQDCQDSIPTLTGPLQPATGKLSGLPPDWIDDLSRSYPDTVFLVEGDGSAGRSLKGHLSYEPVIPASTSLLLPIIGLDVLGKLLNDDNVHRSKVFAAITGIQPGSSIEPDALVSILLHKDGYLRQLAKNIVVLPFLNKAETFHSCKAGFNISQQLLKAHHPQLNAVLAGSVLHDCFVRFT